MEALVQQEAVVVDAKLLPQQMEDLLRIVQKRNFIRDRECFLSIYTVWLFNKREIAAVTMKQAATLVKMWHRYFAA